MKRLTLLILVISLAGLGALVYLNRPAATDAADAQTMRVANQLYANGQYAEATQMYEQLVEAGGRNADVYYNLGNAYYQQGDMAGALLNFRRAQQLDPRDADIEANLALARSQIGEPVIAGAGNMPLRLAHLTEPYLTLDEAALIGFGLWLLLALLFVATHGAEPGRLRRLAGGAFVVLLLITVVGVGVLGSRVYTAFAQPAAIVTGNVSLAANPNAEGPAGIGVKAGTEVHLMDRRNDWVQVLLPGRSILGWLPQSVVVPVSPDAA